MRQLGAVLVGAFLLIPAAVWAADEPQANAVANAVKAEANTETMGMGAMDNEEMVKDNMPDPMPTRATAAEADDTAPAVTPAPAEEKQAEAKEEAAKAHDHANAEEKAEHAQGMTCMMGKKHPGPKDMVMMNMMMQKMKKLQGAQVVATYDGGIVVVKGNKITKYDDELNYVNEIDTRKGK